MDVPYAIQTYLQADAGVQAAITPPSQIAPGFAWPPCGSGGIFLLELDPAVDAYMPFECVVVDAGGGAPGFGAGSLAVNEMRILISCYGRTIHLAYVLSMAVYQALKHLANVIERHTYVQWCRPLTGSNALRDPDTQWPYVVSSWQALASDLTIAA